MIIIGDIKTCLRFNYKIYFRHNLIWYYEKKMMNEYKHEIRSKHPSFYSQGLINSLFFFPYTKINILKKRLDVSYLTARKYLDSLVDDGLLEKIRLGRDNYYVNIGIMNLLSDIESGKLKIES